MANCRCGCGREAVPGGVYYEKKCRHVFLKNAVRYGMLPLDPDGPLIIKMCETCKDEFLTLKYYPAKTCKQFAGTDCNLKLHSENMQGNTSALTILDDDKRPAHIHTYCHRDGYDCECAIYSDCMGHRYDKRKKDCFIMPTQRHYLPIIRSYLGGAV